ncbi:MAG: HAMP domain-containing sensor histidine kinase [Lachnospiraceae bacterium]|nr:HAMP domain-containing sensor histidine kinase [Lachnospiraceae bacterium]
MFKKLHVQLTLFFTAIAGLIVVFMTILSLYLSEQGLIKTNYVSFLNTTNTIVSYLGSQNIITQEWLAQQEQNGAYLLSIYDNGQELRIVKQTHTDEQQAMIAQAEELAASEYGYVMKEITSKDRLSSHTEFSMTDTDGAKYYVSAMTLLKSQGTLHALVLFPLAGEQAQIWEQRLLFGLLDLAGILILGIFCWFFTNHMLRPLEENRQKQAQFIASASHELRSPLSVIRSSVSALKKAAPKDAPRFADAIDSEATRMSSLVGEMLTLANSDAHTWQIKKVPTQLDTLVLDTYEKYELLAADRHIRLSVNLPDTDLPDCLCDSARISQVLSILLDNALRYTPADGMITLRLCPYHNKYQIRVGDNGPGIPDDQKEKIFRRFYRSDTARSDRSHFGLGLCIAQEIITLHKGKIWVEDATRGGAEFVITLP